ncbi:MAG: DUF192 domain-containing protein [Xanthomonadales bacterium]|nr:DUF192 domain-containing protein [Xanthomonadales bacterium]
MRLLLVLSLTLLVTACQARPDTWVEIKGQRFYVEVVQTEAARQQGLMHRTELPSDQGMLFLFDRTQPLAFWMKNTLIPLDIFYFDDQRRLVSVARNVPPCKSAICPSYPSAGPSLYTLELNAGSADALGVRRGDELAFGPGIPERGQP